jgi:hypothetical protein
MIQYTEKTDQFGNIYIEGIEGDSLLIIPIDPTNSDYQAYLKSLES